MVRLATSGLVLSLALALGCAGQTTEGAGGRPVVSGELAPVRVGEPIRVDLTEAMRVFHGPDDKFVLCLMSPNVGIPTVTVAVPEGATHGTIVPRKAGYQEVLLFLLHRRPGAPQGTSLMTGRARITVLPAAPL